MNAIEKILEWIIDVITLKQIYVPLISVFLGTLVYKVIRKALGRFIHGGKNSYDTKKIKTIIELVSNICKYIIVIIVGVIILEAYGIDTVSIIAGLGVLSAVIGLAFQDTLKDFINGVTIILENYYIVGDSIIYKDFTGEVIELGLKSTKIKDCTGQVMTIANRNINEIINISQKKSTIVLKVLTDYRENIDDVESAIKDIIPLLNKIKYVTNNSAVYLGIDEINSNSVTYLLNIECIQDQKYQVKRDALKIIKTEFDKKGIKVPYQQIEVRNEK